MDPLYAASSLTSASRQATDPRWPQPPLDREMASWSPGAQAERSSHLLATVWQVVASSLGRVRFWRSAPAEGSSA